MRNLEAIFTMIVSNTIEDITLGIGLLEQLSLKDKKIFHKKMMDNFHLHKWNFSLGIIWIRYVRNYGFTIKL